MKLPPMLDRMDAEPAPPTWVAMLEGGERIVNAILQPFTLWNWFLKNDPDSASFVLQFKNLAERMEFIHGH